MFNVALHIVTHSFVKRFPNNKLTSGQVAVHFLFIESRYFVYGHVFLHVKFADYEKYPEGHKVTHFNVKGFEK
jgi:hypothetical protein